MDSLLAFIVSVTRPRRTPSPAPDLLSALTTLYLPVYKVDVVGSRRPPVRPYFHTTTTWNNIENLRYVRPGPLYEQFE